MKVRRKAISDPGVRFFHRWRVVAVSLFVPAIASLVIVGLGGAQQLTPLSVELISVDINGASGNAASSGVSVNADGSQVAFYSDATDLVRGDTNQARDVFVRDRGRQLTERVSVSSAGEQANHASHATGFPPAIDADGQIVAFYSDATNLVADDTNSQSDVFVRLRSSATTERVSLGADGAQGNGPSLNPSINREGDLVAFQSQASNLVPDDHNGESDIFVRDRGGATTERVCDGIEPNGDSFAPSISANGQFVAFTSGATNLVPTVPDKNGHLDIFVCDRATGAIDLVSVSSAGVQGNGDSILPAISLDGRFVAFKSIASNLVPNDLNNVVDVFVRDRVAGVTERVSLSYTGGNANDASFPPSISYDGRFVAFGSAASNIVRGDVNGLPSVFVRDRVLELSLLVDVNALGQQANGATPDVPPGVSGDGREIGYVSFASNLVTPDRNETSDVFIAGNPFFCQNNQCPSGLICQNGMCGPEVVPTPTPVGCCQCAGNSCVAPVDGGCLANCDLVQQALCLGTGNCATLTPAPATATPTATGPTVTPTATIGANDCCQCEGNTCAAPNNGGCSAGCVPVRQAACLTTGNCATFTPTPTVAATATAGASDCCQCEGNTCAAPNNGGCSAGCVPVRQAACLTTGNCATFTPTPTVAATATAGASDCCQCEDNTCAAPNNGGCSAGCVPVRQAACLTTGNCATFTPTPTVPATATAGASDCCQCEGNTCTVPGGGACPTSCTLVRQAACLGTCATFTPGGATTTPTPSLTLPTSTPTAKPTTPAGVGDCCQCKGNACTLPSAGTCPVNCNLVGQAACLNTGACATFTPLGGTVTPTPPSGGPTATATATVGANECCQCDGTCTAPSNGGCPSGCAAVSRAVCLTTGACATFTPLPTTPTVTPPAPASPTSTRMVQPSSTPTRAGTPIGSLDQDACQCAVGPNPHQTRRGVMLWLSGPVMLLARRLRRRRSGACPEK